MPTFAEKFQLSADQRRVINALVHWLRTTPSHYITVGGYAGTGKTTLVSVLRLLIKHLFPQQKIAFACYTGKASQVLKQKITGNNALFTDDFCGTIHSLMYTAVVDEEGKIQRWKRNASLPYDILIIDEASMVTSEIWQDLSKYNIPMIAVGDHGQLPPIDSNFNLMDNPELRLETIHRQAEGSPIIEVATIARETGEIPFKTFSPYVRKVSRELEDPNELLESWAVSNPQETLILCARNKTRVQLNKHMRALRGFTEDTPQPGETVICLKNNYEAEGGPIYNGMLGTLRRISPKYIHWYDVDIELHDDQRMFSGEISQHQFFQEKMVDSVKGIHYSRVGDRFDFGYALTVHKAQGSQARTVIVFEEYAPYMSPEQWRRWLYTAVTRASERLLIIR